ncbi:MAG: OmpA family protein, partial [Bacteroidota bacterium]
MKKRNFSLLLVFLLLGTAFVQAQDNKNYKVRMDKRHRMDPIVNTLEFDEFAPTVTADGNTMVFESNREGKKWGNYRLYHTMRDENGKWSEPMPIASVNDKAADGEMVTGPWLSPDGLTLYFSANYSDSKGDFDIYMATRESADAEFGEPMALPGSVNGADYDGFPSVSADGRRMYFMRRAAEGEDGESMEDDSMDETDGEAAKADGKSAFNTNNCYTLMMSKADADGNWGAPTELPSPINGDCAKAPRILADGETIYYATLKEGTKPGGRYDARDFDIVMSQMNEDGSWTEPKGVEGANRGSADGFPQVIPMDNATALMYFSSQMNMSYDLYYTVLAGEAGGRATQKVCIHVTDSVTGEDLADVTVKVENMTRADMSNDYKTDDMGMIETVITEGNKYKITIEYGDYQPYEAMWDYTSFETLKEIRCLEAKLQPKEIIVNITVVDADDEIVDAAVEMVSADNESVAVEKVEAGKFVGAGEQGKMYTVKAEAEGFGGSEKSVDLTNVALGEEVDVKVVLGFPTDAEFDNVNFNTGRAILDEAPVATKNMESLNAVLQFMNDYPTAKAIISGHTDERATEVFNQGLSERRAQAAKAWLMGKGISADRLETIGYGESRPQVPNRVDGQLDETNMAI